MPNARFEAHRKPAWKEAAAFNMQLDHKVALDGTLNDGAADKGYSVEMAIPWTQLPGMSGPPTPDNQFRINFYRLSNSGTWASAWAPVGNDFHDLTLAGTATFVK